VLAHILYLSLQPTTPPELYPLSLHDALPILSSDSGAKTTIVVRVEFTTGQAISRSASSAACQPATPTATRRCTASTTTTASSTTDRKSTRLNSSHRTISYAVFCLKKKNKTNK